MREIKFRAWDSLNNQMWQAGQDGESIGDWTFQTYFNLSTHCFKALIYSKEFLVTDDPYPMYDHKERFLPIMQYTGLTDKNGLLEIYECDIININGEKVGNVYENENILTDTTNFVIGRIGTKEWSNTEQEAIKRGCFYA